MDFDIGLIVQRCWSTNFILMFAFIMCFFVVIDDAEIVYRDYVDISVAVATPKVRGVGHSQILLDWGWTFSLPPPLFLAVSPPPPFFGHVHPPFSRPCIRQGAQNNLVIEHWKDHVTLGYVWNPSISIFMAGNSIYVYMNNFLFQTVNEHPIITSNVVDINSK